MKARSLVARALRFALSSTSSFREMDHRSREGLAWLHDDYFFK